MNNFKRDKIIELLKTVQNMRIMRKSVDECADYLIANDVEVVVRCKDCLHCRESDKTNRLFCTYHDTEIETFPDRYCSCADKKEEPTKIGFNVGDICIYQKKNGGNGSVNIVEITELKTDVYSEIKVIKVITDNSGNGYFEYLLKTGKTMNASNEYLRKLEPKELEDLQIGV